MRIRNNTLLNWLVLATIVATFLAAYFTEPPVLAWLMAIGFLVLAIILIGLVAGPRGDNDRRLPMAALIDDRNKISLSRFQTALWTVLIISAFVVAVMHNIRVGQNANNALNITVPTELWALLGISGASLVGASLIKSEQGKQETPPAPAAGAPAAAGTSVATTEKPGILHTNPTPGKASFYDMFRGEETTTWWQLSLGKIQMFFFTILVVFVYGVSIASSMFGEGSGQITTFPAISEGIAIILGISHATYLGNKSLTRTDTTVEASKDQR